MSSQLSPPHTHHTVSACGSQVDAPALVYVDSHCHLDQQAFDADRPQLWSQCQQLGVRQLIIPGVSPTQWQTAAYISQTLPGVYYSLGFHPYAIAQQPWFSASAAHLGAALQQQLRNQLGDALKQAQQHQGRCVAVGECGLDKRIAVPMSLQQELLALQIELANDHQLPLIVHSVKTHNEILACFKHCPPRYGGVIHAFSGSLETAQQFIARGFLLGVGGTISYARAQKTRATFSRLALEHLLLETDAPDMPLCGYQGERNSPLYVPQIAQLLAQLQGVSLAQLAASTRHNAQRLFGLLDD